MTEFLIGLGANLALGDSDPTSTLERALALLESAPGIRVARVSRWFRTPAWPPGSGPDFVNGAAALESDLDPFKILQALHDVEVSFGRDRRERWAPRVCDLDLLAAEDRVIPDPQTVRAWMNLDNLQAAREAPHELILPHPRLHERGFVMAPLCDVASAWRHPILGLTAAEILANLPDSALEGVRALSGAPG